MKDRSNSFGGITESENMTYEAEPLFVKLRKMSETDQPIKAETPIIYTEKKDGVLPAYDIRTDRFEIALEAAGKVEKAYDMKKNSDNAKSQEIGGIMGETEKPSEGKQVEQ